MTYTHAERYDYWSKYRKPELASYLAAMPEYVGGKFHPRYWTKDEILDTIVDIEMSRVGGWNSGAAK
jgi:hypothetical protein